MRKKIVDNIVVNALYKFALEEEKEWRRCKENRHDVLLIDELLRELRKIGYKYRHYADLTNRENNDQELWNVVMRYIGRFDDEGISAELVGVIGKKGNYAATEIILDDYINCSEENRKKQSVFYDNALYRIKDKRYIDRYLKLLSDPNKAIRLPFTMSLLGKWQVKEAKEYFFEYLDSDLKRFSNSTGDLVFHSLKALSYYKDLEEKYILKIKTKLLSDDPDLILAAKKALKKLNIDTGS